ncbi:anti-sigma factor [Xanthobacter sp. KR7-65]|uniref:anti-sigma factor n=1 Tax=Xanthobacter sp. KR7-65 TaxID=3156612 RepID=UPI0032B626A7
MSEDTDALAGEYVLGLLDPAEALRCARLEETDAAFAVAVGAWRSRFAEIDLAASPEPPPDALWERIAAGTRPMARPAMARRPRPAPRRPLAALWDSLPVWRGVGLSALAASLVLALGLGFQMRESARAPVLVAVLLSDQNRPQAVVNTFRDGRAELVPLAAFAAPEGKSLQVWTLWDRARGPVSVGLIDAMKSLDLVLKDLPAPVPDQLFEVTLEPAGGSPTGRPTGPILMKGTTSRAL